MNRKLNNYREVFCLMIKINGNTYLSNHQPIFVLLSNQITDMAATATDEKTIKMTALFFLRLRLFDPELS